MIGLPNTRRPRAKIAAFERVVRPRHRREPPNSRSRLGASWTHESPAPRSPSRFANGTRTRVKVIDPIADVPSPSVLSRRTRTPGVDAGTSSRLSAASGRATSSGDDEEVGAGAVGDFVLVPLRLERAALLDGARFERVLRPSRPLAR